MTISILALGSRGDVQPYAALGRGLSEAGYRVRLVSFASFESLARQQGLDFAPVPGDAEELVRLASSAGWTGTRNPIRLMRAIQRSYGRLVGDYIEGFSSGALSDSSAIINQLPGALFGRDLAEKLRVPHIVASVIPLVPTRAFPNPLLAARSLGGPLNRLSYTFAEFLVLRVMFGSATARFRQRLGLPPTPPPRTRPDVFLNGFSPRVIPPPSDWGPDVYVTGYWMLREPDFEPEENLLRFLEDGEAPVFIGFGSMIVPDPSSVTRTIIEALRLCGRRGIISSGWANLGGSALPENVHPVGYVPYGWLLPRMAAVVHHGGSGTTGFALRSGVPSMVVAFTADQPFWGERTAGLGVGVRPISIRNLKAESLARGIDRLCTDRDMQRRAAELGAALRDEDGLSRAVAIVRERVP